jgi:hypothetical protein
MRWTRWMRTVLRRRRVRRLARRLPLPVPFDVTALCRDVGARRGRPIVLTALPLAATGSCGLWLATDTTDYICYELHTSAPHQQHIVLHEIGHVLCGHGGSEPLDTSLAMLFPQLSAQTLRIMLARQHRQYIAADELEAELFAYAVLARIASAPRRPGTDEPTDQAGRLARALDN